MGQLRTQPTKRVGRLHDVQTPAVSRGLVPRYSPRLHKSNGSPAKPQVTRRSSFANVRDRIPQSWRLTESSEYGETYSMSDKRDKMTKVIAVKMYVHRPDQSGLSGVHTTPSSMLDSQLKCFPTSPITFTNWSFEGGLVLSAPALRQALQDLLL